MKRTRLNVWQRAGIVASAAWAIGAFVWEMSTRQRLAAQMIGWHRDICSARPLGEISACMDQAGAISRSAAWDGAVNGMFSAFIWPALVWPAAYLALWTIRWVLAGRRSA